MIDADCRDKIKEVSHFLDDEPVLTAEDWNAMAAEVGVSVNDAEVGWNDAISDDGDWDTDEQDEDCDEGGMD